MNDGIKDYKVTNWGGDWCDGSEGTLLVSCDDWELGDACVEEMK
jgi:hypothetical protein